MNLRAAQLPIPTERTLWIAGAVGAWFVLAFLEPWLLWVGIALDLALVALVIADAQLAARRKVVVVRDVPRVVHQGHVLAVRWGVSASHAGLVQLRDPLHPALSEQAFLHELRMAPDEQAWLKASLVPRYRGAAPLAPLSVRVQGPLGLAWAERTQALDDEVDVFPKTQLEPDATVVLRRILNRRLGAHAIRLKGMADELYALRTYLPGDAMRTIHWKASARLNRPVTRESQLDQHQRTVVLVDCGRPMSTLSGAMTKLDHTLSAVLALLRAVVASEDTATLVLFSKEVRVVLTVDRHQKSFRPVFERLYAEAADAEEADYPAVAQWAVRRVRERALVVLCTSVIDPIGAERVQEAVTILARRHRPLLVDLQDPSLHEIARSVPVDAAEAYAKVSAMGLVHANRALARTLRAHGVDVLSVPASKLAVSLLQHYLDVKARRQNLMDEGAERSGLFAKGGVGRFLLVLTGAAGLLFTVACGAFIALMAGMEHFLPNNDEEIASSKNEGAAFASGHTVTECVTEAQARGAARCDGLAPSCNKAVAAFARACVSTATEDGYCATTPKPTGEDLLSNLDDIDASLEWQQAACTAFPPRSGCQEVMGEVHAACLIRSAAEHHEPRATEEASDLEPQ